MALRYLSCEVQKSTEHTQSFLTGGEQKLFVLGSPEALENYLSVVCFSAPVCLPTLKLHFRPEGLSQVQTLAMAAPKATRALCSSINHTRRLLAPGHFLIRKHSREISLVDVSPSWKCESSRKQPASNSPTVSFGLTETYLGHTKT